MFNYYCLVAIYDHVIFSVTRLVSLRLHFNTVDVTKYMTTLNCLIYRTSMDRLTILSRLPEGSRAHHALRPVGQRHGASQWGTCIQVVAALIGWDTVGASDARGGAWACNGSHCERHKTDKSIRILRSRPRQCCSTRKHIDIKKHKSFMNQWKLALNQSGM